MASAIKSISMLIPILSNAVSEKPSTFEFFSAAKPLGAAHSGVKLMVRSKVHSLAGY